MSSPSMKKILFLLHLPPPVHGSSIVGRNIYNSKIINKKIKANYINLSLSNSVSKVKSVNILKILYSFVIIRTISEAICCGVC